MSAETTVGEVITVDASDDTCGSKRSRHSCTKFTARVQYQTPPDLTFHILVSAGSARGHGQPVERAVPNVGDRLEVVYSTETPSRAYQNTLFGVWGVPLMAGFFHVATMIGSLTEGRRRRW